MKSIENYFFERTLENISNTKVSCSKLYRGSAWYENTGRKSIRSQNTGKKEIENVQRSGIFDLEVWNLWKILQYKVRYVNTALFWRKVPFDYVCNIWIYRKQPNFLVSNLVEGLLKKSPDLRWSLCMYSLFWFGV